MKIISIFILVLSLSVSAQKSNPRVIVKFPTDFYSSQPSKLLVYIKDATEGYLDYFKSNLEKVSEVSTFNQSKENNFDYFLVEFKNPLTVEASRKFFFDLKLKEVYTPANKKIYTEDLLSLNEIEMKKNKVLENYQVTEKSGNPAYIDYYNFNIYNIEAKMQSLYFNNYPENLFNGNVAMMKDKLRKALEERNEFVQRQK